MHVTCGVYIGVGSWCRTLYATCYARRPLYITHAMGEEIQHVLGAINALNKKFFSTIAELKNEMMAGQVSASQEVVKRIDKHCYQFQKKGNEMQFLFHNRVDKHVDSARQELIKVMPGATEKQQLTIKKAVLGLDKGLKVIAMRQKYIRIADHSELG